MSKNPIILWFRQDLRLSDHPALHSISDDDHPILPLFIHEEVSNDHWLPGAASRFWLHHALKALDEQLKKLGSQLVLRRGDPAELLVKIAEEIKAEKVVWTRRYEPAAAKRDHKIEKLLIDAGCRVETFGGRLLREPSEIGNENGSPPRVFTPYWKRCIRDWEPEKPLPAPKKLSSVPKIKNQYLDELELLPQKEGHWDVKLDKHWEMGELAGQKRLKEFAAGSGLAQYNDRRNYLATAGTSSLSPYLAWGHISPRQIWHSVAEQSGNESSPQEVSANPFIRQLFWREFSYAMLVNFPHTPDEPLREEFAHFPWQGNKEQFDLWSKGKTGYPIVDAGMRQLWEEGYLHNRARMVVGSFLTKDLRIHWQWGAKWFWDTLVDADLADNTMGWQWVAGCGADSAPYFRIFNPLSQSTRFDEDGDYLRRYIPILKDLPTKALHAPSEAEKECQEAGIVLDRDYPKPMVDHKKTRQEALDCYGAMRGK